MVEGKQEKKKTADEWGISVEERFIATIVFFPSQDNH